MLKKCPYCNQNILTVNIKTIPSIDESGRQWNWVAYTCPNFNCNAILSVWIDPVALKTDTINDVINKLKWN